MHRAILLRHGYTAANLVHRYCGSTDLPLEPGALAEFLEQKPGLDYPDPAGYNIVTSGMIRTEETLTAIYGDLPHRVDPAFQEIDFGLFENHSYEELKDDPAYQAWISGDNEANVCPGGESGVQMTARVLAAWEALSEDTLLVSHGGVIAAIMAHLFPEAGKHRWQWQPKPFGGYALTFGDGGPQYREIPLDPV